MNILIKEVTSKEEIQACLKIRDIVFVQEQNVPPHLEVDGKDDQSNHYLLLLDNEPVGTARVRFEDDCVKIERFAIIGKYQGKGLGKKLLEGIIAALQDTNVSMVRLSSQTHAIPFYKKFGFLVCSQEYMDAGIPHKDMKLNLKLKNTMPSNKITLIPKTLIYQTDDGGLRTNVTLHDETVWLTQKQIAELFNKGINTINDHIQNIFSEEELSKESTIRKFRIVRQEGLRQVTRNIEHYNLEAIISVGYRVKSKEGTRFRIWANKILREYLMQGYALDRKRLKQHLAQVQELQKTINLFQSAESKSINQSEASGLLNVLINYTHTFVLLNQYDTGKFPEDGLNKNITVEISLHDAMKAIQELKEQLITQDEATNLFGSPKDDSFAGILGNIVQSFGGEYLYPSIEEQAAHLLYFIIKNHPFTDGNKRIGAFMFIWFLQLNQHHLKRNGEAKINDNALVAIALLVAQSDPAQKETMIKLIINLIKDV